MLIGAGDKGQLQGLHQPGHAACQGCPWAGTHQLLCSGLTLSHRRFFSFKQATTISRDQGSKGHGRTDTGGESQKSEIQVQAGRHNLKPPSSPTGCEIISDAEVSPSFGVVQGASSANVAVWRAGETLLSSTPDTSSKISIGQKGTNQCFHCFQSTYQRPQIKQPPRCANSD